MCKERLKLDIELRIGVYDLEGNRVEYEGGEDAYDVDSASYLPVEMLYALGTYVCSFEEDENLDYLSKGWE